MEIQEALQIVRKLADGIHPETGKVLQTDLPVSAAAGSPRSASRRRSA